LKSDIGDNVREINSLRDDLDKNNGTIADLNRQIIKLHTKSSSNVKNVEELKRIISEHESKVMAFEKEKKEITSQLNEATSVGLELLRIGNIANNELRKQINPKAMISQHLKRTYFSNYMKSEKILRMNTLLISLNLTMT
jgi:chromosome segregation ATPase